LHDIDVASGCAADYDGWLLGGARSADALVRDLAVAQHGR
jgi:hypothetical protein